MKRIWNYLLTEPFIWLFYCFFQPEKFKQDFEIKSFWKRIVPMIRLALPLFLISYTLVLITMPIPCGVFFHLEISCYPDTLSPLLNGNWSQALTETKYTLSSTSELCILGIIIGILWGIAADLVWGVIWSITLGYAISIVGSPYFVSPLSFHFTLTFAKAISIAITFGIIVGIVEGFEWSKVGAVIVAITGGIAWTLASSILKFVFPSYYFYGLIRSYVLGGAEIALAFFISYLVGYYRLPLYLVSGLLGLRSYFTCRKKPAGVFTYLHRSPLYWDERIFLPLPGLKHMLLIASEQNLEEALKEMVFIATKRPQQLGTAQAASLEIAIQDLEIRDNVLAIARASQRLAEILPQEYELIDPRWSAPIAHLKNASRDAARYCGPFNWQTQRKALEDMIANLEQIHPNTRLRDSKLGKSLGIVISSWRSVARSELSKLELSDRKIGYIDNPYNAGKVLELRDTLFVGRRDIVLQLSDALSKGGRCPPFLLNGERRMGKSSTLKQLPALLGSRYIPILYDLQSRGITSSTDMFLATIAKEIYVALNTRGVQIKKINNEQLREKSKKNQAMAYQLFDEWLKSVELVLIRHNLVLLLLFDEFEKLDETEQGQDLNLNLLLDWFRSTIQNRSHLALLFSGVHAFSEMGIEKGINWANYFVNAQTLKVSFLRREEAYHLITQPVPNFPSNQIFGEGVVDEITQITGCHPFLVQAVCSTIIDILNVGNRNTAEMHDVKMAMSHVLESWEAYFRDLWQRSSQEQRKCLLILRQLGESDLPSIKHMSDLDEKAINHTLQTLRKRDLVLLENYKFRIATPIFSQWVERYS